MNRQLWTVSNSLSVLRVILVLPIAVLLASAAPIDRAYAIGLIVAAVLTDFFDGFFARRFGQITDVGKIIDPIADKIGIAVVCVMLTINGDVPLWFVLAAVARDVLIVAGGLYLKQKKGILLQSNMVGKWTVGIVSMYIFFVVLHLQALAWLNDILLVASAAMLAVSFAVYGRRFIRSIGMNEAKPDS